MPRAKMGKVGVSQAMVDQQDGCRTLSIQWPPLWLHILWFGILLLLAATLWELPVWKDIFVPGERISVLSLPHRALAAA